MDPLGRLSRRERQIMDIVYARGAASVTEVLLRMSDPPSRTSVRTFLRILEQKGHLEHDKRGKEFVYRPTRPRKRVAPSALRRVLSTFFDNSIEKAVATFLNDPRASISNEGLNRLAALIRRANEWER